MDSHQLSAKYPKLPALLIGPIETLMWSIPRRMHMECTWYQWRIKDWRSFKGKNKRGGGGLKVLELIGANRLLPQLFMKYGERVWEGCPQVHSRGRGLFP